MSLSDQKVVVIAYRWLSVSGVAIIEATAASVKDAQKFRPE